jgi:CsoR family transcriptional regulator, copper-sensing transcriptional repressor
MPRVKTPTTPATKERDASEVRTKIQHRLRRLEGQVRGLQKMIDDERECKEILTQLVGARAALETVGELILETYLEDCQSRFERGQGQVPDVIGAVRLLRA